MKKIAILVFFFLAFTMEDAQAADWQQGEVLTGKFDQNVRGTTHVLTLEEDARVTFTLKDGESGFIVALSDNKKQRIASIARKPEAGNEVSTVQSVNLKAGTYSVYISEYFLIRGDYTVSYEKSKIKGTDLEPNNEDSEANPYKLGDTYRGALYGKVISYDYDIYKVEIPMFGKLTLHAQITEGTKYNYFGFEIEVLDASHRVKRLKLKNIDDPSELQVLLQPGTYYFKISLNSLDEPITDYTFSTKFEQLDEQAWESGLNIGEASADVLENNKTYNGFVYSNTQYDQIRDYYKFVLEQDAKVMFIANAKKSLGALLFSDERGIQLSSGGYVTSDTRNLVATKVLKAGTYYVGYSTDGGSEGYEGYDLTMRIERFTDVPATHMYYEQIEGLANLGINKGYTDGTFHPDDSIKRKHVFVFLSRIDWLDIPKIRTMKTFKDLKVSHPDYPSMKAFYEAGIVDGSGSNINPESNLTRGQMAKILVKTFDLKMKGKRIEFLDVNSSNGFYDYIQILASNGITIGSNGKFMPNAPVTRQHFSIFLYRTLELNK